MPELIDLICPLLPPQDHKTQDQMFTFSSPIEGIRSAETYVDTNSEYKFDDDLRGWDSKNESECEELNLN